MMGGIFLALAAALFWGGGDFCGGFASRRHSSFQVVALSAFSGVAVLAAAALLRHEAFPALPGLLWALLAGLSGAVGIIALYRALSSGNSAVVAPTAAVIGAVLPVAFTLFTRGAPAMTQLAGFALAFLGIWLVSRTAFVKAGSSRTEFWLACLAGVTFGGFFIFIAQVGEGKVFTPLILTRSVMLIAALVMLRASHLPLPQVRYSGIGLLAGILDAGGNVFFMLAKEFTRLDTAVIVSSLYPGVTVILTGLLLKEKIGLWQKVGVVLCLLAIVLITL